MSILNLSVRPTVTFDPANRQHRQLYVGFLHNRCWTDCPVQFYLERGYGDLVSMIENKLSTYYLQREFKDTIPDRSEQWAIA